MLFSPVRVAPLEVVRCNDLKPQAKATKYIPPYDRTGSEKAEKPLYKRVIAKYRQDHDTKVDKKIDKIIDKGFVSIMGKLDSDVADKLDYYRSTGDIDLSNSLITASTGGTKKYESKELATLKDALIAMKYYLTACVHNQVVQAYIVDQINEKKLDEKQVRKLEKELDNLLDEKFSIKNVANEGAFLSHLSKVDKMSRKKQIAMLERLDPADYSHMSANDIRSKLNRLLGELLYDRLALTLNLPTLSAHIKGVHDQIIPKEEDREFFWTVYPKIDSAASDLDTIGALVTTPESHPDNSDSDLAYTVDKVAQAPLGKPEEVNQPPFDLLAEELVTPGTDMEAESVKLDITTGRMSVKQLIALWESR